MQFVSRLSEDRFLDGKATVRQPTGGFRSGLDAVMLAAAVPADGEEALELGAGAGAASLCLAVRVPACTILGVDIDEELVALANTNARINGVDARVRFIAADVLSLPAEFKRGFRHVFSNPPFHRGEGECSSGESRRRALSDIGCFADWLRAGVKRAASGGTFTTIFRADRLAEALSALPDRGITIFPLWPRAGVAAKRVILRLRKGSRAELALLPGLVLHETDGRYTRAAEAVLREGASLALDGPRL